MTYKMLLMFTADCIIIGSGLAGLASALTLHRKNLSVLVIDPLSQVGGKVRTRMLDSEILIDEGFQVLLNSYPELSNFVDLEKLNLKNFGSGALIFDGQKMNLLANPVAHPQTLLKGAFNPLLTFQDKLQILQLIVKSREIKSDAPMGQQTTLEFLKNNNFSEDFIENFWRPFLTGVYLDSTLSLGSNFFRFLIHCFSLGQVSLPERGMGSLPELMSKELPTDSIRLNTRAVSWTKNSVTLDTGEILKAKQIICAFDVNAASDKQPYFSVTTYYFTSPHLHELNWDGWLILIPQHLGYQINHMALLSSVSPSYAGKEKNLLSVSLVGKPAQDPAILITEIEKFAARPLQLNWIQTTEVKKALPAIIQETDGFKIIDDVIHCGDYCTSPSINGALRSGRLAAEHVIKNHY